MKAFIFLALLLGCASVAAASEPIKNYTTFNSLDKGADITLSNGNLTATNSSGHGGGADNQDSVRTVMSFTTGKRCWEMTVGNTGGGTILNAMILGASADMSNITAAGGWWLYHVNGALYNSSTGVSGPTYGNGDTVGVCVDADAHKAWFAKNGTFIGSGNPATGANPSIIGITAEALYGGWGGYDTGTDPYATANFGASPFTMSVPSGFMSGLYTLSCPEGETLNETETECTAPVPPDPIDGGGFAVAGVGAGLAGITLCLCASLLVMLGAGCGFAFTEGFSIGGGQ